MELPCDVILDLMPLYQDKIVSETSVQAIRAHLKQCPSCRRAYHVYPMTEIEPSEPEFQTPEELREEYEKLAKRIRKRHYLRTSGVGFYVITTLILFSFMLWRLNQIDQEL